MTDEMHVSDGWSERLAFCCDCGRIIPRWWMAKHPNARRCPQHFLSAFADLMEECAPLDNPEWVDQQLRDAGLDPEKIGREAAELVDGLLKKYKPDTSEGT